MPIVQLGGSFNENCSLVFEILNVAGKVRFLDTCINMVLNGWYCNKDQWSRIVWERLWINEDEKYYLYKNQIQKEKLLFQILDKPYYLIWWFISDINPRAIKRCETIANLACDTSHLKATDCRMKRLSIMIASRFYEMCDLKIEENVSHIVMQCPPIPGQ